MKTLLRILRWFLSIPSPRITPEQARESARAECLRRGWEWEEPTCVHERLRDYWIWTAADRAGGNVSILVDSQTGEVLEAGFVPY